MSSPVSSNWEAAYPRPAVVVSAFLIILCIRCEIFTGSKPECPDKQRPSDQVSPLRVAAIKAELGEWFSKSTHRCCVSHCGMRTSRKSPHSIRMWIIHSGTKSSQSAIVRILNNKWRRDFAQGMCRVRVCHCIICTFSTVRHPSGVLVTRSTYSASLTDLVQRYYRARGLGSFPCSKRLSTPNMQHLEANSWKITSLKWNRAGKALK